MKTMNTGTRMTTRPKRTFVVGDIHGALKALQQCILRSKYNQDEDQLIFLGDYIDGWSDNAKTIEFLYWFAQGAVHKPIFLKGNHDQWVNTWLNRGAANPVWIQNGGKNTIRDYIRSALVATRRHREFFENLEPYHIDSYNRGYVHAGFCSPAGLGKDFCESEYAWDRTLWTDAMNAHGTVASERQRCFKHTEIFIGHTPTQNYNYKHKSPELKSRQELLGKPIDVPMNRLNVWNVDTGAGWPNGKLTIMDTNTKEFWQSDNVSKLYPNENPR
jgi:serine/threonine protein phosphatase 1